MHFLLDSVTLKEKYFNPFHVVFSFDIKSSFAQLAACFFVRQML
jgi:hypothetical protein